MLKDIKLFGRRAFLLFAGKFSLLAILVGRLYHLQILRSSEYKTLSENNHIKLLLLPPMRGIILDRLGNKLAVNQLYYRVILIKRPDYDKSLLKIAALLNIPPQEIISMEKKFKHASFNTTLIIKEFLTWNEITLLELNDVPNMNIEIGYKRYYPFSYLCAHVIGYVGSVAVEKVKEKQLLNHPDFKIGKTGIEKQMEEKLRGKAGIKKVEVNAYGHIVRELERQESILGQEITLTIDIRLQEFIVRKMEKYQKAGASAVIDLYTGQILALVSSPSFNPNLLTKSSSYWQELTQNKSHPLVNKAIMNAYPPGSPFKLIIALTALQAGVNPEEYVYCSGAIKAGDRLFHCWNHAGHGKVNMVSAIAGSCNCYFFTVAKSLQLNDIISMAQVLGLGQEVGIELPNENKGLLPDKSWKKQKFNQSWHVGDMLNTGIGQGYLLATPLQLLLMISRIATGKVLKPTLTLDANSDIMEGGFKSLTLREKDLILIRKALYMVVNKGQSIRADGREFKVAGKTGTAQVISSRNPGPDQLPHALFVGYGPFENPRFSCVVMLEHGQEGKRTIPIAQEILLEARKLND